MTGGRWPGHKGTCMTASLRGALHGRWVRRKPRELGREEAVSVIGVLALAMWVYAVMLGSPPDAAVSQTKGEADAARTGTGTPEMLVGGYGGVSFTHPSDVHFSKPGVTDLTAHGVNWDARPFKSPIYYGLRTIRWSGSSPFGAMIDFTHAKTISQPGQDVRFSGTRNGQPAPVTARIGSTFKHFEFSHGHNMLTLNGLARLFPISPVFQPYVGGGLGVALPHTEVQFADDAKRTYEYQYAGPVGQAVAGLEIRLPRVSLFIEYKFSVAKYDVPLSGRNNAQSFGYSDFFVQLAAWWRGEAPLFGYLKTILASHHLVGGVGVRTGGVATAAP
jgi:lipid A oxidase